MGYTCTPSVTECATGKFAKKLLGESEIEAVLQRLDRLTQVEARITAAQTFGVVHGLVGNMKEIMEGAHRLLYWFALYLPETRSVRSRGING